MSLLELELTLETPMLSGSWRAESVDRASPLRPQSIKGVWRWWARAYAGGALYEMGCLKGRREKGYVRVPGRDEAEKVSSLVGAAMGLGYADPRGRESRASAYTLMVESVGSPGVEQAYVEKRNYQRVALLTLGGRKLEMVRTASLKLSVEEGPGPSTGRDGIAAALGSLLTSLTLSCFGKGGRRGLGCFSLRVTGGSERSLFSWFDQRRADSIARLLEETRRAASRLAGSLCKSGSRPGSFPPMPVVSKVEQGGVGVFSLYAVEGVSDHRRLHNFFVRTSRQRVLGRDPLRLRLRAWVLGLPRSQKGTGYHIKDGSDRRASPLLLASHGRTSYLSVFASADWPSTLEWKGRGRRTTLSLDENAVANALKDAVGAFKEYAGRLGFGVRRVWP